MYYTERLEKVCCHDFGIYQDPLLGMTRDSTIRIEIQRTKLLANDLSNSMNEGHLTFTRLTCSFSVAITKLMRTFAR